MAKTTKKLDVRGLNCPLPILKAKKTLGAMNSGETLMVYATDPGTVMDFQAYSKQTGNELTLSEQVGSEYRYILRKS